MTRSVFRHAWWVIRSAKVPNTPLVTHEFRCAACPETSGPCAELGTAQDWAMRHSGANPTHTGYQETAIRHWVTTLHN